ncbi:cytochrome ubiquinol oxidase subunit I [Actinobacteria bacterium YIM 96077]|uniref:Cytochrome ubiquinol oxidase subunit I n=1 Tax=Phytoactinopolyspora halophila TaxID=1981511 RepID=A0A329QPE7_9ACTN|nr:cytochrome ubiquinol oxidase subunit I [Phytoactinopolyspora halophila]AYY14497.1 cytochrome ubiquinol oxidase subunit I [Actinobacteria bacterium YIM 96077]RAW14123.1 cytochrome ubiquinol oxidase subunit I [Phytoactinopolyspora halophila]
MDVVDLARWQFGLTTVVHYFFVPFTISMAFLVAIMQTIWMRTNDERWLRLTKFFGKLLLINLAVGVVTGLVQEFQFGLNWSDFSRFVGDIFGAPLAMEALLAFYLESVFVGVWIFGWGRIPPKIHLATIWITAIATLLSAYFILAANSFMQNPVGYEINEEAGRAELTDIWAVLTNKVTLVTFPHTIFAAFMVGGAVVAAVAMWHLVKGRHEPAAATPGGPSDPGPFRKALRIGAVTVLIGGVGTAVSGDIQGKIMTEVQPMKMAAAEALYETQEPAPLSLFTVGTLDGSRALYSIEIPQLLSFLSTGSFEGEVRGINDIQEEYEELYGPGEYAPNIPATYWTFRLMIGFGVGAAMIAAWQLWATRRGQVPTSRWALRATVALPFLPLLANTLGWIFTEMGRQPWLVFGLMPTASGVTPGSTTGEVLATLITFTVLYAGLTWLWIWLLVKHARPGLPDVSAEAEWGRGSVRSDGDAEPADDTDRPLTFAY